MGRIKIHREQMGPKAKKELASAWYERQTRLADEAAQALEATAVNVRVYNGASDKDARAAVAASGGINVELLSGSTLALKFAAGQAQKNAPQATVSPRKSGAHRPSSSSAIKKRK